MKIADKLGGSLQPITEKKLNYAQKNFYEKCIAETFEFIYAQFAILSELTNDAKMFKKKYPDLTKEDSAFFLNIGRKNTEMQRF